MRENKKEQARQKRTFKLALLINKYPHVWTSEMLADRYNIKKATVQEDINLLRQIGIVVEIKKGKQGFSMREDFIRAIRRINDNNNNIKRRENAQPRT